MDGFSFFRVILTFLVYNVFWDSKSYVRIDTSPTFGMLLVIVQHMYLVSQKSRCLCPRMGNQSFSLREFQLELLSQEHFQLVLDFFCF